ncbi:hypothetical protein N9Z41_02465 [bacterium]|nr:hypothetical protein [bacterium]
MSTPIKYIPENIAITAINFWVDVSFISKVTFFFFFLSFTRLRTIIIIVEIMISRRNIPIKKYSIISVISQSPFNWSGPAEASPQLH